MTTVPPSGGPSFDDGYTNRLHNPDHDQDLSVSERSGKHARGVYTNDLHNRTHFVRKRGRIYYRRRVPESLRAIVGKTEVWRSLGTDSPTVAMRRSHHVAAVVECQFQQARLRAGLAVDQVVLSGLADESHQAANGDPDTLVPVEQLVVPKGFSLREVYDAYMADPTRDWSPRTRLAYDTTRRMVLAVLGEDTPIRSVTRARCRELIEVLRWLPRHSSKLYPGLEPNEIAAKARATGRDDLISASNVNTYLNKLCGVFNWALKEQMIDRNPALGLKMPDPTLRRDKRLPFSSKQLRAIFSAPLYVGCQDDGHGYAKTGHNRPRNARFWIPLVGLFGGLRLNEACQLDVADITTIDGIACFAVTAAASSERTDKRLKTASLRHRRDRQRQLALQEPRLTGATRHPQLVQSPSDPRRAADRSVAH